MHRSVSQAPGSRILTILVAATLAVASLAACSSHGPSSPPPSASPPPETAWQSVLHQIKPDGSVTTETALSAFAMAIGPVPGGVVPPGPSQDIVSGSIAIRWVLRHWGDLSQAQHSAILTDLGIDPVTNKPVSYVDAPAARIPDGAAIGCQMADSKDAGRYRPMIPPAQAAVAAKLHRTLIIGPNTFVVVNDTPGGKDPANALLYTVPCYNGTGDVIGCTIHVNPRGAGLSAAELSDHFLHEMTHCFMYDKYGSAYSRMPDWYAEGGAAWVESVLGHPNGELARQWKTYLDFAPAPLVLHTYDGLGIFVHLAESGVDPWTVLEPMADAMVADKKTGALVSDPTAAAWAKAGITPGFLNTWGSGIATGRYPGSAWTTTGPNLPPYQPKVNQASIGNGGKMELRSVPYAPNLEQVNVTADVLVLRPDPGTTGRMTLGNGKDTGIDNPGPYCTMANCSCPAGSPGAGTTFTKMASGDQYVGFTGNTQNGILILTGSSLTDFCQQPKTQTPCVVGQWVSTGFDLHVNDLVESGGAGIKVHIDNKGNVSEVLDGMQPVMFQQTAAGMAVAGSIVFSGSFSGSITLPPATATSGIWTYASPPSMTAIRVAVHLSSPFASDLGTYDLSNLASMGTASGTVPTDPIGVGRWTCSGNTLTSQPPANSSVQGVWTLTRTGPG